ncbi:MAG TPA: hypothetical protein PKY59_25955 [Pyrinomonadaceae bacterium]|nr:hypothetical protein [Pyrinomonadaceae bacterium]
MKISVKVVIVLCFLLLPAAFLFLRPDSSQAQNNAAKIPPTAENRLQCDGCHGNGKTPAIGGEQFHKTEHKDFGLSVHSKLQQNGKPAAVCQDCHTVKGDMATDFPPDDPRSTVFPANQAATCGKCHEEQAKTFHTSIHGNLLDKGDVRAASCSDCHGKHNVQATKDANFRLNRQHVTEICIKCHSGIVPDYEKSTHGMQFRAGNEKAPICVDCHSSISHNKAPATTRDFSLQMIDKCSSCHEKQAPTYHETFHGQATAFGYKPAATCADCHTPHKNLPASNPDSSVNAAHRVETCSACHTNSSSRFASYDPHPEPHNPERSYLVYIVSFFMKWLLIGVFSFFGLHTILWLQRAVVGLIRGENHKRIREEEDQWIVRFSSRHRLTHLLLVISFLGLAATGLPLMYSFTEWGRWLVGIHGGVGVTRFLHRACALITIGYALYHLSFILQKVFLERDFSIFKGGDSMIPRWQDVKDLFGMVKWFFYIGERPKLDHFTYWEKFDYFAVFWGVPVIGFSGLMLWFPGFFTTFLPGEVLNIAMIVHSEEALLATAFIFAIHFFHTHLRPESFPMDLVMFTGKMRLSWFKEERAIEYERLVAEGKLDDYIVPPPTKTFRFFARIFGFAAYITGLVLVIWIIATLLTL